MKIVSMVCPNCGASIQVDIDKKNLTCNYCGNNLYVDDEVQHVQCDNTEDTSYQFEKGRRRTENESNSTPQQSANMNPQPKKRRTWLWVLGWICIFPLPLTILMLRKKDMKPTLKYGVIAAAWIIYFIIGGSGGSGDSNKSTQPEETISTEAETSSLEGYSSQETESSTVEEDESTKEASDADDEKIEGEHYDESLNGRGEADSGREEPQYVDVIGYVAISSSQAYDVEKNEDFQNESFWIVPTYEQDKQFWNEVGTLPHKTEVVVREQMLEHEGYGAYSGHLLVEKIEDGSQYYINVSNFITKPYWTYQSDLRTAAMTGDFIAEYKQTSDYYPVDSGGDKLEIPDGTIVLVTGVTGTSSKFNRDETGIEAIVWKDWRNGHGGVNCYFNNDDLTILY